MKQRWPAALATVYEIEKCERGEQKPPGTQREHLFDFPDGVRLIVSRDQNSEVELHLSFGVHETFQADWRARGSLCFRLRCHELIAELQRAGLIKWSNFHATAFATNKALHFWFPI